MPNPNPAPGQISPHLNPNTSDPVMLRLTQTQSALGLPPAETRTDPFPAPQQHPAQPRPVSPGPHRLLALPAELQRLMPPVHPVQVAEPPAGLGLDGDAAWGREENGQAGRGRRETQGEPVPPHLQRGAARIRCVCRPCALCSAV